MSSHKLGDLLAKVKRPGKVPKSEYLKNGKFPIIDQGQLSVAGYTNDPDVVLRSPLPITVFGDHTRAVKFAKRPFACGADGTQLLYPNTDTIDPTFFYYAVENIDLSNYFYARHFKFLKDQEIEVPPIRSQRRIASILSAYDDLIENNWRRIQLLEQSAQLLYKEWFVNLRFPGHDHITITDGVPEGWEKKSLGEIAPLNYGKALKKDDRIPGPFPVFGSSGIIGTHEKSLVPGPAIIVGRKGNVGSTYWSQDDFYPIDTVYFIEARYCSIHLYHALLNTLFINTDVAVPGLNRDFAHSRLLLRPDNKTLALFEQHATEIYDQINRLTKYNQILTQARDLLLPRLMNGEIVIEIPSSHSPHEDH